MRRRVSTRGKAWLAGAVLALSQAMAAAETIPFTPGRWDLEDATVEAHLGRTALSGTAWLKDTVFADGVIEVDLALERQRSYPAIIFRRQTDGEYEHVYLRPHRAGFYPDAIQYAPAFNGVAGWQLYNGPGYTAGATLPENQWVHLRLEVQGSQARLFVGPAPKPALVIDHLERGDSRGGVGLQSPRNGPAVFSAFSCTADGDLPFAPPSAPDPVPGLIRDWSLSPVRVAPSFVPESYLDGRPPDQISWLDVEANANGLVDVARFLKPLANDTSKVWARTVIPASRKGRRRFSFGYSDDVSLYLNGELVFRGRSGYRRRDPSFLGIVGWNDTVNLDLKEGDNELAFAVSEDFGGWGFMCRDLSAVYQDPGLHLAWEISGKVAAPESVIHDAGRQVLYVTGYRDGSVARVSLDGQLQPNWVTGLQAPTGIRLSASDRLFVVERAGLVEIDPSSGEITGRRPIPDAGFPNDLAFDEEGAIYVTDTLKDCVYRITDAKPEVWVHGETFAGPNGILVEGGRLLVGVTSDGTIKSVDLETKRVDTLVTLGPGSNMDGLVSDGEGGLLFSDYFGRLFRLDAQGRQTLLLDGRGPYQFCADFGLVPGEGLIVIPSLYGQRITAYRYDPLAQAATSR
jgi:sugar lactone lactonase YvrE